MPLTTEELLEIREELLAGEPAPRDSMHEWLKRASDQLATPVSSADERSDKEEEGGAPPAPPMRSISSMEDGDDFRV